MDPTAIAMLGAIQTSNLNAEAFQVQMAIEQNRHKMVMEAANTSKDNANDLR